MTDIAEILMQIGLCEQAEITRFKSEEDGEDYDVWHVTANNTDYVLKKAKGCESAVYDIFLSRVGSGAPRVYKTLRHNGEVFILMEYIKGEDLRKCDRESLILALDALIHIQSLYWEDREHQDIGSGFEASLPGRRSRGEYLGDAELERAYEKYLQLFSTLPRTLCHDDLLPFNVLVSDGKATIIDWEYAGILPYPTSLVRLIAHGAESDDAFFYMKEDDKTYAIEYYYEHLIKKKGISYGDYRRAVNYFLLYEYCEWIMLGNKYGDTESDRYMEYLAKAKEHLSKLE